jgi:cytochrome c-type biogenesis protein CcmF
MEYVGEHLAIGALGNAFVILAFCAALLSGISYLLSVKQNDEGWKRLGRLSFYVHSFGLMGIIGTLLFMIFNHYFEYHYVWQHSSFNMEKKYLLSAFWEGQEGSFLLWAFWHMVLGLVLIWRKGNWEAPVMTTFGLVQAFLASMVLGVYIFGYKLGSNPFTVLLRDHPEFSNIPLFSNPNYLDQLDGRGLNPLLQNYWNTIHPPTTFLGFASTLTPFAFAIAGLWIGKYKEWVKPALPWTFFSVMALGTGLLMGGAWAYEALSFGGFWAWDPVENASLVPWLTIVGAGHLMLIEEKRGGVMKSLYFLSTLSFILILYSTFLTKSGVLGEASVHAFTDLGMSGQLLVYLFTFLAIAVVLFVYRYKSLPTLKQEEELWSREFWMFVGALVLFVSAFQISVSTSLPVINSVFGTDFAPPTNPIEHYNMWQIPFAIITLMLIGFGQFLNYKNTPFKKLISRVLTSIIISLGLSLLIGLSLKMLNPFHLFMLFAGLYAVIGNLEYWIKILKGKIKYSGASIAHVGFGLMMVGALISQSKQQNISNNTSGVDVEMLGEKFTNDENLLLMKGDTLPLTGEYYVAYRGREKEGINVEYVVDYFTKNETGYNHAFTLKPRVQTNERMGNVPEPDTRHFITQDIYTHVTWARLDDPQEINPDEYEEPVSENYKVGDTLFLNKAIVIIDSLVKVPSEKYELNPEDIAVEAVLTCWDFSTKRHTLRPVFVLEDTTRTFSIPDGNTDLGVQFQFQNINPENGSIALSYIQKKSTQNEFIVMQAIVFPYINVLWLGSIIMVIGTFIAIRTRLKTK